MCSAHVHACVRVYSARMCVRMYVCACVCICMGMCAYVLVCVCMCVYSKLGSNINCWAHASLMYYCLYACIEGVCISPILFSQKKLK